MATGRNDPCPCGSGRKYKRCCLTRGASAAAPPEPADAGGRLAAAGSALELGDLERAHRSLDPLLELRRPPEAALELGSRLALRERDFHRAADLLQRLAPARAADPAYHYNLGTALSLAGNKERAVQAFHRALELNPELDLVYPNLGHTLRDLGRSAEAKAAYRRAFARGRLNTQVMSQILLSMHFFCWTEHEELYAMHRQLGERLERDNPRFPRDAAAPRREGRIRLGYLSPRFSREIVGYFFKPILERHDRSRFEIILYNATPRPDDLTAELAALADRWVEIGSLSDEQVCQRIAADDVDILVDLAGHAPENRIGVFARRPAPLQVAMLDYFDTTGLTVMDYYLTDRFSTPPGGGQRFSETPLYLDRPRLVYQPPEYAPDVELRTAPDRPPVFGCFNRHQKIVPGVVETWSGLLQAVPDARLVLKGEVFGTREGREQFRSRFAACGIDPERLEFRPRSPHAELLSEYGDLDIALDTFPYNGGLTSCEALWMGTPVLTLLGERIVSRQTAGMLEALGLADSFVAKDAGGFAALGRYWSENRAELRQLRLGLRRRMEQSALTDAAAYTAELEQRLETLWRERLSGRGG